MPEVFRRLHPQFKTPYLALVLFAGIAPIAILLPGDVEFVGTLYALGATLSFTVAHASMVRLRTKPDPAVAVPRAAEPHAGRDRLAAVRGLGRARDGGLVRRDPGAEPPHAMGRARLDRCRAGRVRDLPAPLGARPADGDREGAACVRRGARARVPAHPRPGRARAPVRRRPRPGVPAGGGAGRPCGRADRDRGPARASPGGGASRRGAPGARGARRSRRDRRHATACGSSDGSCAAGARRRRSCARPSAAAPRSSSSGRRARSSTSRRRGVFGSTVDRVDAEGTVSRDGHRVARAERGMSWYSRAVYVFGAVFVLIGIALLVLTASRGGGVVGLVLGGAVPRARRRAHPVRARQERGGR